MKLLGISSRGMAALAAVAMAVVLVGCPPEREPQPEGDAKVHMLLTAGQNDLAAAVVRQMDIATKQGPVDVGDIESLVVTVTRISFDGPADQEEGQEEEKENGEVVVFEGERDVELMDLREVSGLLSVAEVPAGDYTKIRLHIEDPRLLLSDVDDVRTDIQLTANGRLFVSESFTLEGGESNFIVLDFEDLHLVEQGHGGFVLTPQLRANVQIDEGYVLAEGRIKNLDIDDDQESGSFTLELTAAAGDVEVAFDEHTRIYDADDAYAEDPLDPGELDNGMLVVVEGELSSDGLSAYEIWILEHPDSENGDTNTNG